MPRTLYRASWVLPISSPPFRDGAVGVDGGAITYVGPAAEAGEHDRVVDLGRAALLPGLVNVHTHLELTAMRGLLEDLPFVEWIRTLTRLKYKVFGPEDFDASVLWGALECLRAGVTTVADTGDSGATVPGMTQAGLRGIFYQETFGPNPMDAEGSVMALSKKVKALAEKAGPRVQVGISPHAPYTVSDRLFAMLARWAVRDGLDVAIHAAESGIETEMIRDGAGPFVEGLKARGISFRPRGVSPIQYLEGCGALEGGPLLIHAVQASAEDLEIVARRGARVAHCPRSNAKLGHGSAPLVAMRRAGIAVGLGSDSVASNNVVDPFTEMRDAVLTARAREREPNALTAAEALDMATRGGAVALKMADRVGTLEAGKRADLTAVGLAGPHLWPCPDPVTALVFSASAADVVLTVVDGEVLWERGSWPGVDAAQVEARVADLAERLGAARVLTQTP
jgi:cytosine/adenosine deaminase-related metal-dependent hydrolase